MQRVILNNYFIAIYDNKLRVLLKDEAKDIDYEISSSNVIEMMEKDYMQSHLNVICSVRIIESDTTYRNYYQ